MSVCLSVPFSVSPVRCLSLSRSLSISLSPCHSLTCKSSSWTLRAHLFILFTLLHFQSSDVGVVVLDLFFKHPAGHGQRKLHGTAACFVPQLRVVHKLQHTQRIMGIIGPNARIFATTNTTELAGLDCWLDVILDLNNPIKWRRAVNLGFVTQ